MFNFMRNCCYPEWLYHFLFSPSIRENSSCSRAFLILGIVRYLDVDDIVDMDEDENDGGFKDA